MKFKINNTVITLNKVKIYPPFNTQIKNMYSPCLISVVLLRCAISPFWKVTTRGHFCILPNKRSYQKLPINPAVKFSGSHLSSSKAQQFKFIYHRATVGNKRSRRVIITSQTLHKRLSIDSKIHG